MLKVWEPFEAWLKPFGVFPEVAWPTWVAERPELPVINAAEKEGEFVLTAEVPGFAPEEVTITIENNVLKVEGKHEEKKEEEGRTFRRFTEFKRLFRLPENVNQEAIEAKLDNGLLTLALPKTEIVEPAVKTIDVKVAPKAIEEKVAEVAPEGEKVGKVAKKIDKPEKAA